MLLLIAIPVTIFFIKKQTEVRTKAQASTTLSFSPPTPLPTTSCTSFTLDVMANPGTNLVWSVNLFIIYDPTKVELTSITPSSVFNQTIRAASINNGTADISISTGTDASKAISTTTKVATLTFKPLGQGATQIRFNDSSTQIFSFAGSDQQLENVLSSTTPSDLNIGTGACQSATTPTPTSGAGTITIPITTPTGATATITPTLAANTSPVCTDLSISPASSGSAPLALSLTGKGNDPDGLIAKATFNFGDGQVQDVVSGMNLQSVTAQTNHTYRTAGTFNAAVTFTDNRSGISQSCTKTITVGAASVPTTISTPIPTIAPAGNISTTLGIIGAVALSVIGGLLLLAL